MDASDAPFAPVRALDVPAAATLEVGTARFRDIYDRWHPLAAARLRALGLAASDIEDGLQDVFVVVLRRLHEIGEDQPHQRAWIRGICRRVASRHHRGRARKGRLSAALEVAALVGGRDRALPADHESHDLVHRFLAELDPVWAELFVLSELQGFSRLEVAEMLGIKPNTVASRLHRTRGAFRAFVETHAPRDVDAMLARAKTSESVDSKKVWSLLVPTLAAPLPATAAPAVPWLTSLGASGWVKSTFVAALSCASTFTAVAVTHASWIDSPAASPSSMRDGASSLPRTPAEHSRSSSGEGVSALVDEAVRRSEAPSRAGGERTRTGEIAVASGVPSRVPVDRGVDDRRPMRADPETPKGPRSQPRVRSRIPAKVGGSAMAVPRVGGLPAPRVATPRAGAEPSQTKKLRRREEGGERTSLTSSTESDDSHASVDHGAALLARARRHLLAGDPRAALADVSGHRRRYRNSPLEEVRASLEVRAWCAVGNHARGRRRLKQYSKVLSRDVMARLQRECQSPDAGP